MMKREFPEYFPENCPPDDAKPKIMMVFRLTVSNSMISKSDFVTYFEKGKRFTTYPENVNSYGLSVNSNKEELTQILSIIPGLKKKYLGLCKGNVTEESGVIKATPSNNQDYHHTWWLYKNVNPCDYFEIIEVGEQNGE